MEELYPGAQEEYRKMKDAWRTAQKAAEGGAGKEEEGEEEEDDIEKQVAKELAGLATARKGRTKKLANLIGESTKDELGEGRRGRGRGRGRRT